MLIDIFKYHEKVIHAKYNQRKQEFCKIQSDLSAHFNKHSCTRKLNKLKSLQTLESNTLLKSTRMFEYRVRQASANSADLDQTVPDHGLCCLPFYQNLLLRHIIGL